MKQLMNDLSFAPADQEALLTLRALLARSPQEAAFLACVDSFLAEKPSHLTEYLPDLSEIARQTDIHPYSVNLLFLLESAKKFRPSFLAAGYSDELFCDTFRDLKWKLAECQEVYGVPGTFVPSWYPGFFLLKRFALGRLQFELHPFPFDSYDAGSLHLKKGDPVINMHIPSCGPLTPEACEDSFARAMRFYADDFPNGVFPFFVDSWLIDPDLIALLPEGNLRHFASLFTLLGYGKNEEFSDGWRVFGKDWKNPPALLPTRTRLQKEIAACLAAGGRFGSGRGIFVREMA